jgi:hypothetical protein
VELEREHMKRKEKGRERGEERGEGEEEEKIVPLPSMPHDSPQQLMECVGLSKCGPQTKGSV